MNEPLRPDDERAAHLRRVRRRTEQWNRCVDHLLAAFENDDDDSPPLLGARLEALRNKRDTVVTKTRALEHHVREGWPAAKHELERAQRELRASWRTVVTALERESLFV